MAYSAPPLMEVVLAKQGRGLDSDRLGRSLFIALRLDSFPNASTLAAGPATEGRISKLGGLGEACVLGVGPLPRNENASETVPRDPGGGLK